MGFRMIETVRELQKKVHDLANGRLGLGWNLRIALGVDFFGNGNPVGDSALLFDADCVRF
jgi:hypothetical protein